MKWLHIATGSLIIALPLFTTLQLRWKGVSPSAAEGRVSSITPQSSISSETKQEVGLPLHLRIPRLQISAPVERVGLTPSGDMDVPSSLRNVGWYAGGPRPGDYGTAVMDGHLDSLTGAAVFWNLQKAQVGDIVEVEDDRGKTSYFTVIDVRSVSEDDTLATQLVFGRQSTQGVFLNLVTCTGAWDTLRQQYTKRLVVFTKKSEASIH